MLPRSDAGNDGNKSSSSFGMLHVIPDIWGTLLGRGRQFVQWRRTRNSVKERDLIYVVYGRMESPNTSPQAIKLRLTQAVWSNPIEIA